MSPNQGSLDDLWNGLSPALRGYYDAYLPLLTKWQKSINLVSPSTLADARNRHILDSHQLVAHIPGGVKTIYDLGSGAGFPAMVVAMARPEIAVSCLESDGRKCEFLRTISREIDIPVTIHMGRIESFDALPAPDLITARALASIKILLEWTQIWWVQNPSLELLLPKGESWEREIEEARGHFTFDILASVPSLTDPNARILRLGNIKPISS